MKRLFFSLLAICLYNIGCSEESTADIPTGPVADGEEICKCMKNVFEKASDKTKSLIECNQQEKQKYFEYVDTPDEYIQFVEAYETCLQQEDNQITAKRIHVGRVSKRDTELRTNIASIKKALFAYKKQHGEYISCDPYPPLPSKYGQKWIAEKSGNFQKLRWQPEYDVRGSYAVKSDGNKFKIIGTIDVDGDGNFATFMATARQNAETPITPQDVY